MVVCRRRQSNRDCQRQVSFAQTGFALVHRGGSTHEIRNAGKTLLKTLNIYVPPAYTSDGEELPRGRS